MLRLSKLMAFCVGVVVTVVVLLTEFPVLRIPSAGTRIEPMQSRSMINDPSDVLIVTYMRSGSTFLGKMLGWRKDTFYWYEPLLKLHQWHFLRKDGNRCHYLKPECNNTHFNTSKEKAIGFFKDFYQCKLRNKSSFLTESFHAKFEVSGPSWDSFRKCRKKHVTVENCLAEMQSICHNATHKVTKVLRLDFLYADELLRFHPRLKVIFLLRDPRGILNSHVHTRWFPMNLSVLKVFEDDVKTVCSRMERDIKAAHLLMQRFKNRVKIVQYEDIGEHHENFRLLNKFLGISNSESDMIVFNFTTKKTDSFSYRNRLPWTVMPIIDNYCGSLYKKLGLVHYKDLKHLRNRTDPSKTYKLPYALT